MTKMLKMGVDMWGKNFDLVWCKNMQEFYL